MFLSRNQMRLCRIKLIIVLRSCATCHEFRICTGFTRPFWPVRCRPAEGAGQLPKRTAEAGSPLRYSAIAHSCMMVSFYEPRATNHEPLFFHELRFTRGDVVILNLLPQSGILSPRRPANCDRRSAKLQAASPFLRATSSSALRFGNRPALSYGQHLTGQKGPMRRGLGSLCRGAVSSAD